MILQVEGLLARPPSPLLKLLAIATADGVVSLTHATGTPELGPWIGPTVLLQRPS